MFLKKPKMSEAVASVEAGGWDTVLGAGCRIQGDVTVRGSVRIQGELEGSLAATGEVEIELGARIHGDVRAERARVAGRVEGDVKVRDDLELRQGAHLRGDVHARSFRIQDGAIFQGNCHMGREVELPGEGDALGKTGNP
jgi:cytoskeletal protein CcmA (bactofilin family)